MSEAERRARRARLAALRAEGVDPFPARCDPASRIAALRDRYDDTPAAELTAQAPQAAVAGRVMSLRSFGKLIFATLREDGCELQASARRGELAAADFTRFRELDVGDFVRVEGVLWRTRSGELTLAVSATTLLAKALRPLPEKWHGLRDAETRFRHRYLDLLMNGTARRALEIRSDITRALRSFLDGRGFREVETPILQPLYGGAAARPFTTHHHSHDQTLYLRVSDELYLKRLLVAGLDRVYEIGRDFRNEGVSRKHNPEFTMLECYQAFADYRDMMELCEAALKGVAETVCGGEAFPYQGRRIDFGGTWRRLPLAEAIREACGVDVLAASDLATLRRAIAERGLAVPETPTWALTVDTLVGQYVEPRLEQPTFLTDYPVELSPLAKRSRQDPRLAERFELLVAGMELANAFSELNDPDEQRQRFESQRTAARAGDEEAHPLDEDFLLALEYGMPPAGGLGVGVDRLAMLLADCPHLREVLSFPHMRPRDPVS